MVKRIIPNLHYQTLILRLVGLVFVRWISGDGSRLCTFNTKQIDKEGDGLGVVVGGLGGVEGMVGGLGVGVGGPLGSSSPPVLEQKFWVEMRQSLARNRKWPGVESSLVSCFVK